MRNLFVLTAVAAALSGVAAAGRLNDSPIQTAALASGSRRLCGGARHLRPSAGILPSQADIEAIALQTGELYRTTELTTDGAVPRFSPDGRTLLYETGAGLGKRTRIVPANGTTVPVTELHGFGAAYSPDGTRLAYFAVSPTPELARAEAAIDQGPEAERARRQADFNELVAGASRIILRNLGTGRESEMPLSGFSKVQLTYGARGLWVSARGPGDVALQIYEMHEDGRTTARTSGPQDQLIYG